MKKGHIIAGSVVAVLFGLAGFGIWRSRKKLAAKAAGYDVQPFYKLPAGLEGYEVGKVDQAMVAAVRSVYGDFQLHEAYLGSDGLYLVETHEGFSPLVFRVRSKA